MNVGGVDEFEHHWTSYTCFRVLRSRELRGGVGSYTF
jgi:hypothetical protein